MGWYDSAGAADTQTPDTIGPQTDGTNLPAYNAATIPQPADTAGGAPADYSQQVLDLFKFGVGVAQQQSAQNAFFDYKKFEATSGGLYQQGRAAALPGTVSATGGKSGFLMLAVAGIVLVVLLTHKG